VGVCVVCVGVWCVWCVVFVCACGVLYYELVQNNLPLLSNLTLS